MTPHRLCAAETLPPAEGRGFTIRHGAEELRIFVIQKDGRRYAYLNRCPHTGVNLDWTPDRFLDWTGRLIQCATHGALFRIEDGHCIAGPCAGRNLVPLPVRDAEGYIEVRKNVDIAGRTGGNHLFLADKQGVRYMDCDEVDLPFGRQFIDDVLNRTETAMTQAHCFLAMELALRAQKQAAMLRAT